MSLLERELEGDTAELPTSTLDDLDLLERIVQACRHGQDAMLEVPRLAKEVEYWQQKYFDSMNQSIKHGDAMMGNVLMLLMKPGVAEKFAEQSEEDKA